LVNGLSRGSFGLLRHGKQWEEGTGSLLKHTHTYIHKKLFIPQTRFNLVCGIFLFCNNIRPITRLFYSANEIIRPIVNSPILIRGWAVLGYKAKNAPSQIQTQSNKC
jgi:hypothetical protein